VTDRSIVLRTVEQAAGDLCVSVHTIRAWIAQRKIGCVRLGRAIRIPSSEIARLIEAGTVPPIQRDPH
jgi:excisionase family DNA binding protein